MARVVAMAAMAPVVAGGGLGVLELALEALDAAAVVADDLLDVADAVEVDLELVDLGHDVLKAGDLGIGVGDQVPRVVVLLHGDDGALLAQVVDALLDLLHQAVEVAAQGGEAGAVEEKAALGGGAAGGAGGVRVHLRLRLVVAEEGNFLFGQTQLRVRDGVGVGRRHGSTVRLWQCFDSDVVE